MIYITVNCCIEETARSITAFVLFELTYCVMLAALFCVFGSCLINCVFQKEAPVQLTNIDNPPPVLI